KPRAGFGTVELFLLLQILQVQIFLQGFPGISWKIPDMAVSLFELNIVQELGNPLLFFRMGHQKFDNAVNLPRLQAKLVFQSLPDIILVREGELHIFWLDINMKFQPFDAATSLCLFFNPSKIKVGVSQVPLSLFEHIFPEMGKIGILVLELQYLAKLINGYMPYAGITES